MSRGIWTVLLLLLAAVGCTPRPGPEGDPLDRYLRQAIERLQQEQGGLDALDFEAFRLAVAEAADSSSDGATARGLRALEPGLLPSPEHREIAQRLLRRYVVARYGERMVADLREMIRFRTFAEEGRENWDAPEFLRQRDWLAARAGELGFEFRSFDGRVEEITLPGGERTIGILTHGDVQGVLGQEWAHPPWEGKLVDGRIYGRGAEDDKGPIVTTLYVFAALRDSGWRLGSSLRLMVANGEESSWDEIPYYLERRAAPQVTLGVDASYPVTHAQKSWSVLDLVVSQERRQGSGNWRVVSVSGGSGLSIIPERGEALLEPREGAVVEELAARAASWSAAHPPARVTVAAEGQRVRVIARGRGGHSSEPRSGHNAFGDLTAFLADEVLHDRWGALLAFLGRNVGAETDGHSLGIAHTDDVMGAMTVSLALFDLHEGLPRARLNLRVPRGISAETIEARIAERVAAFGAETGATLSATLYISSPPHYVPPDGPLVRTLLGVWEQVTGRPGRPVAIGGGTQARLFPDGVDFGPADAMQAYRGHAPDEYMTVEELNRNAELTAAALLALLGDDPGSD